MGRTRVIGDRSFWTLVGLVAIVLAFGLLRGDRRFAGAPKWYWMEKLQWAADADLVIAGDSRVYRGVDPSAFVERFGKATNFGFSSAKLTREYVERAASLLRPGGAGVLLLGMSPYTLRPDVKNQSGFSQAKMDLARLRLPLHLARVLEEWQSSLSPLALDALSGVPGQLDARIGSQGRALADDYSQVFHNSGWVESDRVMEDSDRNGLDIVRAAFASGVTPTADLNELLEAVSALTSRGIRVFAFRTPVPPVVAACEDEMGYLDFANLAIALEGAGAIWIDVELGSMRSYDGSHLDGQSARDLSQYLSAQLTRSINERAILNER